LPDHATPDVETRIEHLAHGTDLRPVADILVRERTSIVGGWLQLAARQPFHADRPERAVADHIPVLVDAIASVLARNASPNDDVEAPLEDAAVAGAATAHAQVRFEQGLGPVAIATEFRLLRQEISRVLVAHLEDELPTTDVVKSVMVVNDALDGATMLALAALTDRIEQVRDEFLATTLHDVRQPITVIEGALVLAARWLGRRPIDLERLTDTLDGALLATQEMTVLVDTLADASRIAMGAIELDREPAAIDRTVMTALEMLDPVSRARVVLDGDLARDAVGDWDSHALRRVITNLLTNAVKYSAADAEIKVRADEEDGGVHLRVSDRGMGLLPEEQAVLFQRYSRTEEARARGLPGVGLGLYACRGLVEAHGGRIWLESEGRDRGTTAHVVLPLAPVDAD